MVGTADGIQYTQDVRRLPEGQRFNRECLSWVKESFETHVDPDTDEPIFEDIIPPPEPHIRDEAEVEEREVRRMRLYPRYFVKFGYTQDCAGCTSIRRNRPRQGHSEECRVRVESGLRTTADGLLHIEREQHRRDRDLDRRIEADEDQAGSWQSKCRGKDS